MRFPRINRSSSIFRIFENFISLSSLRALSLIIQFFVLPYLIRVLGFEKYGLIVLATTFISYFISLSDYSFKVTAVRDIAFFRNSRIKLNLIYSKVIYTKLVILIFSLVAIFLSCSFYLPFKQNYFIFLISTLSLISNVFMPDWFFQGIEKMRFIAILNFLIKIFFTILIFVLINKPSDFWIFPLLNGLASIFMALIGMLIVYKKYKVRLIPIKFRLLKDSFTDNFPIFINQFLPNLYNNSTSFFLGILSSPSSLGIYDAIRKIIDIIIMILNLVSKVFFPYLVRNRSKFAYYEKYMFVLGVLFSIIPMIFSTQIFSFFNIEYERSFLVLFFLSIGIIFYTLYDIYGLNYFILNRKDKIVMRNTFYSSIIGFFTSLPLIIHFGIIGAAINLTLSRVLMGFGLFIRYKNKKVI